MPLVDDLGPTASILCGEAVAPGPLAFILHKDWVYGVVLAARADPGAGNRIAHIGRFGDGGAACPIAINNTLDHHGFGKGNNAEW